MVTFNGMPMRYGVYASNKIPFANSVYGVISLSDVAGDNLQYRVEYKDEKFAIYNFSTSSEKDAMKYIFCIQNMYPFHTFVYNRHSDFKNYQQLPKDFIDFMSILTHCYSPLSVIVMPMLGRRESYGIWEGKADVKDENGGEYLINYILNNAVDVSPRLEYYSEHTGGIPALINIPWCMDIINSDIASYADAISVMLNKHHNTEYNDYYKGTVMWTDGMSFFHENIMEDEDDDFEYEKNMLIKDIRSIYKNRRVNVYTRKHPDVMDRYLPKGFAASWTGCDFDLNKMIENDKLYK